MKIFVVLATISLIFVSCQESLEQVAARTMKEYSMKNCPQKISETMVMDSCRFEADSHTLHYFYRFMGVMDNDSLLDKAQMRELLVGALKNETSTRVYKEAGYNYQYTYFSESQPGKVLFDATLTAEDYR